MTKISMYPIIFNTVVSYKNGWFFKKKEKRGKGDTGKFLSIIFLKKEIFTWHHSHIFDKVFRGVYEKEIREFDVKIIGKEYREVFENLKKQYNSLLGKYNYQKGYFAEYLILD